MYVSLEFMHPATRVYDLPHSDGSRYKDIYVKLVWKLYKNETKGKIHHIQQFEKRNHHLIKMKVQTLTVFSSFVAGITAHGGILSYNIAGTNYMAYALPHPPFHTALLLHSPSNIPLETHIISVKWPPTV
jgi:hypothetical protein